MIGRTAPRLAAPELADKLAPVIARVRSGLPSAEIETTVVRKDGRRIDVAATLSPVWDESGAIVGTSSIARDITAQRALTRRLAEHERLESLGRLAAGVAHDFNNLLGIVQIYASIAEQRAEDPQLRGAIERIRDAAEQGTRLTQQLLIVGRREPTQPDLVQLNAVIADLGDLLAGSIGLQILMDVRLDPALPEVLADRVRLEQMLINLVLNARDAMPDGGKLTIDTAPALVDEADADMRPGLAPGHYVAPTVADTGAGISPEVREHIFEAFFTTKPADRGTGLGLATVHSIVEEAGGSIEVESAAGMGTTFRILLPAAVHNDPATTH
jgi:signal transduction histidine kinase